MLFVYLSPASIYMFKVNNENDRTMCEIFLNSAVNTLEQCQWLRTDLDQCSGGFCSQGSQRFYLGSLFGKLALFVFVIS